MKKQIVLGIFAFFGAMLILAFANSNFNTSDLPKDDSLEVKVDTIEDNNYPSVKIGGQKWMTENLNVDKFRNGDPIPEAQSESEWKKAGEDSQPAWCYYDNYPANGGIYGKLYNWFAVNDPRGLALEGWHVPSDGEWTVLTEYLGGKEIGEIINGIPFWYTPSAGGKMKSTGTQYWKSPNKDATNSSGFSGLPGGLRGYRGGFVYVGNAGGWWSSSELNANKAWTRTLGCYGGSVDRGHYSRSSGLSVRCLRD